MQTSRPENEIAFTTHFHQNNVALLTDAKLIAEPVARE